METAKLETAILELAQRITAQVRPEDALKFSQAALNLAHAVATMKATER